MLSFANHDRGSWLLRDAVSPLSISEVAALTGVSKSTLSRLWDSPGWTDKAHHLTVQRLGVVIPGVAEYTQLVAQRERLTEVVDRALRVGLEVDARGVREAADRVSPVALALAIDAAAAFTEGEARLAFRRLDMCWGTQMDPAVAEVFESSLSPNRETLLAHVQAAVEGVAARPIRDGVWVGRSIAVHKLIKSGLDAAPGTRTTDAWAAQFDARSRVIGQIMAHDDTDVVDSFRRQVESDSRARANEVWSLVSYSGDVGVGSHPAALSARTTVRRTAADIIADLAVRPGAYAYYLASVAIPALLSLDPGFGGQRQQLSAALAAADTRAANDANGAFLTATHALRRRAGVQ